MAELSWPHWFTFDGLSAADRVSVPSLFVHSDECVFPDSVRSLRDRLAGPVTLAWGEGNQTDFYDQSAQVGFAMEAVDAHFTQTLIDEGRS